MRKARWPRLALSVVAALVMVLGLCPAVALAEDEEREFDDAPLLQGILSTEDILGREKALDDLAWKKIDELTVFDYFNLDAILGFLAKLKITDRWLKLDEQTGRELFRRITEQVRATFKGVEFEG